MLDLEAVLVPLLLITEDLEVDSVEAWPQLLEDLVAVLAE